MTKKDKIFAISREMWQEEIDSRTVHNNDVVNMEVEVMGICLRRKMDTEQYRPVRWIIRIEAHAEPDPTVKRNEAEDGGEEIGG